MSKPLFLDVHRLIRLSVAEYQEAERYHALVENVAHTISRNQILQRCDLTARLCLAHRALASIRMAEDNAAEAIKHMKTVVGLRSRIVSTMASLAVDRPSVDEDVDVTVKTDLNGVVGPVGSVPGVSSATDTNPFVVPPLPADQTGANEPSKDEQTSAKKTQHPMAKKFLHGIQWSSAEVDTSTRTTRV